MIVKFNNVSNILINLSKKTKLLSLIIIIYFILLISYDSIVFQRPLQYLIASYIGLIIVCPIVWFGIQLSFWFQNDNKIVSEKIFNIVVLIALFGSFTLSVLMGVQYFLDGFLVSTFIPPVAFLSITKHASLICKKSREFKN